MSTPGTSAIGDVMVLVEDNSPPVAEEPTPPADPE